MLIQEQEARPTIPESQAEFELSFEPAPKKSTLEYLLRHSVDRETLQEFCDDALALMTSRHRKTTQMLPQPHFKLADKLFQVSFHVAYGKKSYSHTHPIDMSELTHVVGRLSKILLKLPETPAGYVEIINGA